MKVLSRQLNLGKIYPVHRLDKETSGVQVLALNEKAASELALQFQARTTEKFYQGVVAGPLPEKGQWSQALSDKAEGAQNPAGKAQDRKPCETLFRRLQASKYFSWMEFEIRSGRQHQIRKHCALSGHALIGDSRYGNPKYNQKIQDLYRFNRMALHCSRIVLAGGKVLEAPVPDDFLKLFSND